MLLISIQLDNDEINFTLQSKLHILSVFIILYKKYIIFNIILYSSIKVLFVIYTNFL